MGQCASVSTNVMDAAFDTCATRCKSTGPVETQAKLPLSPNKLTPPIGPGQERCSAQMSNTEVQPEAVEKRARDDPEEGVQRLSNATALPSVCEEVSEVSSEPSEAQGDEEETSPTPPEQQGFMAAAPAASTASIATDIPNTITAIDQGPPVSGPTKAPRRMSIDRKAGLPRVQRRMSGGGMMPRFSNIQGQVQPVLSNTVQVIPRGSIRRTGMKRDNSWFVLGFDSNSSSQHHQNFTGRYCREDSWAVLTIPSQHSLPQNTQLRLVRSTMGDSLMSMNDSWTGLSGHHKGDTESIFENSFATCTTRMSSGADDDLDDLLAGEETAVFTRVPISANSIDLPLFVVQDHQEARQNNLHLGYERSHSMAELGTFLVKELPTVLDRRHSQE